MIDYNDIINRATLEYGENAVFELIVKYSGDILVVAKNEKITVEVLNNSFAIFTLSIGKMKNLVNYRQIDYVEIPKRLLISSMTTPGGTSIFDEYYQEDHICPIANMEQIHLTGKGVLVAILDTGIAYRHSAFRNPDKTTRIKYIWDQTVGNSPPTGFYEGTIFTEKDINVSLETGIPLETRDTVGHGTMVAGVCVGSGEYQGVAPDASILVVKLGQNGYESYAMTTEFMRAIKFAYDMAIKEDMPLVLNTSYGTNQGAHTGSSLFEEYINDCISSYPSSFCVPTGNEGDAGHHYESILTTDDVEVVDFTIAGEIKSLNFSIWKNFVDNVAIEIVTSNFDTTDKVYESSRIQKFNFPDCVVSIIFQSPTPYKIEQEIYVQIDFVNPTTNIEDWILNLYCGNIVQGELQIWLPTTEAVSLQTKFKSPSINTTLTIPSTADNVITVSGYNSNDNTVAPFSGRGYKVSSNNKPNISAPAVDVLTTTNLLTYDIASGTSFASPFVAGACALFMEYGLVNKNDPFLYGEKLKAYLEKGADRDIDTVYPNREFGYGTLCLKNTLDLLLNETFMKQ